ncbi:ATP-binding protein [Candidatus Cryosericum septentrionale]|jgi:hypothetical protein|uniref:ATP-binding protein n=1 Tax=Candidatus Cryosericum septentrionale TaxID=2290913 RepID=A0A398E250_9BACT|nr:ATP-binding protein [Candidatus Cryosericum septentrionale]RIE16721.1 hypothetical protein SMC1_05475 [Candidatus Cryosericum septentrionale]
MSEVAFDFPDKAKVMTLLANVYEDPRVALAEFIVNGMDAGAQSIHIACKNGKVNTVSVVDDGCGMSESEMVRIVRNLANSIKTSSEELQKRHIDPAKVIGKMGIGILGYQSFAVKLVFVSKIQGSSAVWRLSMGRGQASARIEPALEPDKEKLLGLDHGTYAELRDISRDTMRLFSSKTLQQYLAKNFADLLRRDGSIMVFVGGQRVTPPPIEGTPFSITSLDVPGFGVATVSLSIIASGIESGDGVSVTSKGRGVVKEIIRLPEFQHAPWTEGVLHGSIEASFLTVAPTRSNYMRDEAFEAFAHAVASVETQLAAEVENARKKHSTEQQSDALRKLREAMGHALHDLELEGSRDASHNIGGTAGTGENMGTAHEKRDETQDKVANPPPRPPDALARPKSDHTQLMLDWRHLGTTVHSQLGEGGRVIVNEDCPDYIEECSNLSSQRNLRYLAKIAAKELTRRNCLGADTDEVMERAIELELRALRYLIAPRNKE